MTVQTLITLKLDNMGDSQLDKFLLELEELINRYISTHGKGISYVK